MSDGWFAPIKKAHYFKRGRPLCTAPLRWLGDGMPTGVYRDDLECRACQKKVVKFEQHAMRGRVVPPEGS